MKLRQSGPLQGRLKACVLAMLLAMPVGVYCASPGGPLPNLGEAGDMGLADERRLGDSIAKEIYHDPDYVDDPVLEEYVDGIWQPLLAAARARGEITPELDSRLAWDFFLLRDRSINAFSLPGGYMGINLGLVGLVSSKDELASVVAHEMSHITQRHISRIIAQQNKQTPLVLGALIVGILAASKNPEAANAVLTATPAMAMQSQLNFSRDMEREADRVGFGVMSQAGFEPQGFTSMFEKLQQSSRLTDTGAYPYLRSHPLTTERIADMQVRIPATAGNPAALALSPVVAIIAARARALANPPTDLLHQWQLEAQALNFDSLSKPRKMGVLTGAIMADLRLRNFDAAKVRVARLRSLAEGDAPSSRLARLLAAELALAQGDPAAALALVGDGTGRPEMMLRTQAQVLTGRAKDALDVLQTWVIVHPKDALAWMQLNAAYNAAGQNVHAIRAEAEAQVAHLDYKAALARFMAAQDRIKASGGARQANDYIEASIIDTRKREVEALVREELAQR